MRRVLVAVLLMLTWLTTPAHAQLFPSNPFPEPAPTKTASPYSSIAGLWGRSNDEPPIAIGLSISEYGIGHITWRTGDEPDGRMAAGKASGWFSAPEGDTSRGDIFETTDPGVIAAGQAIVTLVSPSVLHLAQAGRTWTLCKAVIPAPHPEPPCVDP